jgi:hypothetical protein
VGTQWPSGDFPAGARITPCPGTGSPTLTGVVVSPVSKLCEASGTLSGTVPGSVLNLAPWSVEVAT